MAARVADREHKLQGQKVSVRLVKAPTAGNAAAEGEESEFEPTQVLLLGVPESANDEFVSLFLVSTTKREVVSLTVRQENYRALAILDAPCGKFVSQLSGNIVQLYCGCVSVFVRK